MKTRQGQRVEILTHWFCREASVSFRGDSHQHEILLLLASCTFTSHSPRGWCSVSPAVSNCALWSSKSAGPQMIFSSASHLSTFSSWMDNKPREVKLCNPEFQSESVAQLCCELWARSGFQDFSLTSRPQGPSSAIGSASLQRNGIKLLASGFWFLQKHQQQWPLRRNVLRALFVLAVFHYITHSCHLIVLVKINKDLLKQSWKL